MFGFVALIAFVMLLISIRSVFLAFKGVLMTVLSVAAAYGSLVAVFQWGWLEELGFKPISSLDSTIPPLVLAMTFGLSMDYEIFLLTRIRERFLQTNNTRDAVAYGVSTSARTITSAALIMIAVFIGFAFAGMPLVAQLGVACAVAIAVDATVVRLVLVPALMAMFDEWNWWLPRWLARILPSVDFEKPLPKVDMPRPGHHPRRHLVAGAVGRRSAHGGQVRGQAEKPCPRYDYRRRSAGAERLPAVLDEPVGRRHERPHQRSHTPQRRDERLRNGQASAAARRPAASGDRSGGAGSRSRWTRWRPRPTRDRSPVERQQPGGDHQRPAADGRPAADPDRCGNAAAEELPGHVPKHAPRTSLSLPIWSTRWRLKLLRWCWRSMDRYYCGDRSRKQWVATQLVRRLADPQPSDEHDTRMSGPEAEADWAKVRERCLSVAVAMLEEAR